MTAEQQKLRDHHMHLLDRTAGGAGDWLAAFGFLTVILACYVVLPLTILAGLVLFVRWVWNW